MKALAKPHLPSSVLGKAVVGFYCGGVKSVGRSSVQRPRRPIQQKAALSGQVWFRFATRPLYKSEERTLFRVKGQEKRKAVDESRGKKKFTFIVALNEHGRKVEAKTSCIEFF